MAAPDRRGSPIVSRRRYFTFRNSSRTLHQNVTRMFDLRQWTYESARVLDCTNGEGRTENWGPGWLCATIMQSPDSGSSSGSAAQGCMSLDITSDDGPEKVMNMFHRGSIVCNKTVSSVATPPGSDGTGASLLTLVADGSLLQVILVEHSPGAHRAEADDVAESVGNAAVAAAVQSATSMGSSSSVGGAGGGGFNSSEERRRDKDSSKSHDDDRRKRFELCNGTLHRERTSGSSGSSGGGGGSGSGGSSGLSTKQKERSRRLEEECSPRSGGEPKRQKTHHDPRPERDLEPPRSSTTVDGNADEAGAVSFLNSYAASSLSAVSDGGQQPAF
uniref:E1 protein n=1 Tax=Murid herpesvirus 1 TaxID=10366 RepID=Q89903_MUHV1|nr:e1 protein [Murid betaherpesvirus 1]AAA45908.1 early transcription unit e1 [Murid betaherpesvirus 1]